MQGELIDFIRENEDSFYRLAYSYVKNPEDAVDMVYDSVADAIEKYGTLKDKNRMRAWFYRILVNNCLMFLRRRRGGCTYEELPEEATAPEDGVCMDDSLTLYKAIDKLPHKYRTVIILRYFEDMSIAEIARSTSVKLSTVKSRLYHAYELLREELGPDFWEEDIYE